MTVWNKYAYNYDFGTIIYDSEVFKGRIKGKLTYTEEEAKQSTKEIRSRLCIMAKACGYHALTIKEINQLRGEKK